MHRRLHHARWLSLLLAIALFSVALSGCAHKGDTAGQNGDNAAAAQGSASEMGTPSENASETADDVDLLPLFLPSSSSYNGPYDFTSSWTVTTNADGTLQVKETVGDTDTTYTLTQQDGCLVQLRVAYGSKGTTENTTRTWFCLPPKSFTNSYTENGSDVTEKASETWVDDADYGRVLQVSTYRTDGDTTTLQVDKWASGLGLVSRVVSDKTGTKVQWSQKIIFAGS